VAAHALDFSKHVKKLDLGVGGEVDLVYVGVDILDDINEG